MRIYEDLLNEALQQQTQSLKEIDNDLYRSTGNMISRATAKSFRELCQKLLQQNKELISYTITNGKDTNAEDDKHEHERQQLKLEINQKEQKAQSYLAQLTQAQE
jgi:16S rRNA G527 N7-methylase RsmG